MNGSSSIAELAAAAVTLFRQRFEAEPDAVAAAPGRVNLIGEHVDYEGGLVMPMAIDRWLVAALKTSDHPVVRGVSAAGDGDASGIVEISADDRSARGPWVKYIAGVLNGYRELGWGVAGVDVAVVSSLPAGAGLSSSAALETAVAVALEQRGAPALEPADRARLCQQAEHDFAGVPCGVMDQLAVGCANEGHALAIDCRTLDCSPVALPSGLVALVVDTGVRHELGESEYPKRRAECREAADLLGVELLRDAVIDQAQARLAGDDRAVLRNRATHVINEISRVRDFVAALQADDRGGIRRAMAWSHDSLRDLYEVSCPELDALVSLGRELPGVVGCRMTGGGFGGSAVMLVEEGVVGSVAEAVVEGYRLATGLEASVLKVAPVAGAAAVELAPEAVTQPAEP